MHIFVFGNINTGKTTFCKQLLNKLPSYSHLSLDIYRQRLSDGTLNGEKLARHTFVKDVINTQNAVVDFTGFGDVADQLRESLNTKVGIAIVVERALDETISDIDDTKYQHIPYPEEFKASQSLTDTIRILESNTTKQSLETAWKKQIWQSYRYSFAQTFEHFWQKFPIIQHQWIARLNQLVLSNPEICEAVLYGSAGANNISDNSDIDLFIASSKPRSEWLTILSEQFKEHLLHIDLLDQKIALRLPQGILLEISIGTDLSDIALYYRESQIYNLDFTLLKVSPKTLEVIKTILDVKFCPKANASNIAAQCYFLFCSLPKLIACGDSYKYAFHCMIIRHYSVQLEHLLIGSTAHNYLPKQAAKSLPSFPWNAFVTTGEKLDKVQYFQLFDYIKTLFFRLEDKQLIAPQRYFTEKEVEIHHIH